MAKEPIIIFQKHCKSVLQGEGLKDLDANKIFRMFKKKKSLLPVPIRTQMCAVQCHINGYKYI